jgi:hypothetical protein
MMTETDKTSACGNGLLVSRRDWWLVLKQRGHATLSNYILAVL